MRSAQNGEAREIGLGDGIVHGEMGVPAAHAFDDRRADREHFCGVFARFASMRRVESTRRVTGMTAQAQAAEREFGNRRLRIATR